MPKGNEADYNETKRPVGERANNPQAEVPMREVNMLDWAEKEGVHAMKIGMTKK